MCQDLAFNETWFIGEALLFAAIMSIGLLSALGVLGRVIVN